jgi:hypothetical protein
MINFPLVMPFDAESFLDLVHRDQPRRREHVALHRAEPSAGVAG